GAGDLRVDPPRDQKLEQGFRHLRGRNHDSRIDQPEATADFKQPNRDSNDCNSDPARPAHSAANLEYPSDFIDSPRRLSHSRPVISPKAGWPTILLSRARGQPGPTMARKRRG